MSSLFIALSFLFFGPGEQQGETAKPGSDQIRITEDTVYSPVDELRIGGDGWISRDDVIIDHEGFVWIKADASARSQKKAALHANGKPLVKVTRSTKGHGLIVSPDLEWKTVLRENIPASSVVPCKSWQTEGEALPLKGKGKVVAPITPKAWAALILQSVGTSREKETKADFEAACLADKGLYAAVAAECDATFEVGSLQKILDRIPAKKGL